MMEYGDLELVSTIFHELAHQLIYVSGDSEFNESFAVSVEQEGLRFTTNVVGCPPEDVHIGLPVRVQFEQHGEVFVPVFVPDRPG